MTGGGNFYCTSGGETVKATHGFTLHCDPSNGPNRLQINWEGNRFHLEDYLTAFCELNGDPSPPEAPINTLTFSGEGRYNGESGATITGTFTDNGEPGGGVDEITVEITFEGTTVLSCSTTLNKGNHQAHRETP
jgi:hypothetical protein